MLPCFRIRTERTDDAAASMDEVPEKPKRRSKKQPEVPTHRTYAANFNGRKTVKEALASELSENVHRISKRYLAKENERLLLVNQEFASTQEHLTRKNSKLKEKIAQLSTANEELANENDTVRIQYQDLINRYNDCVLELERPKQCQKCLELNDLIDKTRQDYGTLRNTNKELVEDCNMLKNVIYRLNVQLEKYLQKQHEAQEPLNLGPGHSDHRHSPISWGKVNTHTLAPLLTAYQETIQEKEDIIEGYQKELSDFTVRLKEIIRENEELYVKLNDDSDCSKVLGKQLEALKVELKDVKGHNDLLIQKCALKQNKIEEILKCYEQKIEQVKRDYTVLQDQYCRSKTEIATLKEKNKSLSDLQSDFKNERAQYIPISVHNSSVNECKRWYEELKQQYENERAKLDDAMEQLKTQINDLNAKLSAQSAEKLELEAKLRNADKNMKRAETRFLELEHSLHEVQLSRSACRKQLHKAMNFARDLVNEQESLLKALSHRQQENKVVKKLGTDIASRMDVLRNQLKAVQKEAFQELSTVEERMQEQDSMITSMKEEHEKEVEHLKKIIRDRENRNLLLRESSSAPPAQFMIYKGDREKGG